MDIKIGTTLKLPVLGTEQFNGKDVYRVLHKGREYRVKRYPGQPSLKKYLTCTCTGESYTGWPMFEQNYSEILGDLYKAGKVYSFKLTNECTDYKTGAFYYQLDDENGLRHRIYVPRNPLYKVGESVKAKVLAINDSYLSLELMPKDPPPPSSYSIGDVVDLKQIVEPKLLDFTKLNPEKDSTLRDYQIENKRKIYEAWQTCRSVMLQMPTGTGKTRLFVSIARDIFDYGASIKKAFKVLILAHRKELIEQISEHLGEKYRLAHGLIISQSIEQKKFSMQVGSVPTLNRRLGRWEDKNFDVIIIDEAHHVKAKSYKKIIDLFPNAKILGVTATPYRLNHAGFRPEFDDLIVSPSVAEFIKRGYLCEYDYYSIRPNSELQKEIDRMKLDFEGDYKESEMMDVMDRDGIRADILDAYLRYAGGKKAIVYTISRAHNIHLAEKFQAAGIVSASIDSETPKEKRDEIVGKFRRGDIQVLFNVNIFSEGFDCPDVEVIQLARPTKSLSMYLQQVGRGLRPAEGKERLLILDNVGLYNKFGFPSARRKWRYHFEGQDVDETPAAHRMDRDEEREVKDIVEGSEDVAMLHTSADEEVSTTALDSIIHDYKDSFVEFSCQKLDMHTVQGYVRSIENTLDGLIKKYVDPAFKSLFNTVNLNEIEAIRAKLFKEIRFIKLNNDKHHVFSAAFNKYRAFAKWHNEHQSDAPAAPDILPEGITPEVTVNYRNKFKAFLLKDRFSDYGAEQAINALTTSVDRYIKQLANPSHKTVFETSDVDELTKYYDVLMRNLNFAGFNKLKGSRPGSALKKYIEFAKSLESKGTPLIPEPEQENQVVEYHPYQKEFEDYLAAKGINRPSIRKYVSALKDDINPLIRRCIEPSFISIYANNKLEIIQTMYDLLKTEEDYLALNRDKYNAPDVAFRKYIDFLEEMYPSDQAKPISTQERSSSESEKAVPDQSPLPEESAISVAEIDATLKELENLVSLLKKNNLPVNPEVEERQRRLRAQKASLLQKELIIHPIEESMKEYGLDRIITFKYSDAIRDVDVLDPTFGPELNQNIEEIEQIVSLLTKNNLSVPQDVHDRRLALTRQQELKDKIRKFENWLVSHMTYTKAEDIEIESVYYSPRTGFMVQFKDLDVKTQPTEEMREPELFEREKPVAPPKVKGKAFLRVKLEDGSYIEHSNASDTLIDLVEHVGIQRVRDMNIVLYHKPMIDNEPHPNYRTQCKQLSDGSFINVLSTTEKKMQLINSIAEHYGLSISAEIYR